MSIGENIKKFRENKNLTQEQLAEKVGVHRTLITQVERGTKGLSIPTGQAIAKVLDCTLNDLINTETDTA
jgi:transcriptional regulator with XRE-family HTH domain